MKTRITVVLIVLLITNIVFGQATTYEDSLFSKSLNKTMYMSIVVPSTYSKKNPIPILYLLHGYSSNHDYFIKYTDIEQYVEESCVLCVTPEANDSWYVNAHTVNEDRYEDYIINDLANFIQSKYSVDKESQIIAGFSMGGYGALTLALRHPGRFDFAASLSGAIQIPKDIEKLETKPVYQTLVPSIDRAFGEQPNTFRDTHNPFILYKNTQIIDLPYIFLFVGLQEEESLVKAEKDFADSLNAYGAFFESHKMQGSHNSATVDASLNIFFNRIQYFKNKAYKSFITPLLQLVLKENVEKAIDKYRELKVRSKNEYVFNEWVLNLLGYQLLSNDMVKDAIEIFKLNVEEYPNASNPYDSLGEAYMLMGNKKLAGKNYKRSLELNPDNTNAIKMLKELK